MATATNSTATLENSTSLYASITPFNYLLFLAISLLLFLGYLILPRGLKAQYFGTGKRRRYRRQRINRRGRLQQLSVTTKHPQLHQALPSEDLLDSIYAYSHSYSPQEQLFTRTTNTTTPISTVSTPRSHVKSEIISSQASALHDDIIWSGVSDNRDRNEHDEKQSPLSLPEEVKQTLRKPPGIKFIAHGTKCKPRPVWITLNNSSTTATTPTELSEYQNCLTWRAELKSNKKKLGNLRKVTFDEVLGIELGKKSTALRRVQTANGVNENDCFSLLTKTGTLDLECVKLKSSSGKQSSAEEVRAAFITCLALAMMSSKNLNHNHPTASGAPSLQSQLEGLRGTTSQQTSSLDERTIFSSIMSEAISTVSF